MVNYTDIGGTVCSFSETLPQVLSIDGVFLDTGFSRDTLSSLWLTSCKLDKPDLVTTGLILKVETFTSITVVSLPEWLSKGFGEYATGDPSLIPLACSEGDVFIAEYNSVVELLTLYCTTDFVQETGSALIDCISVPINDDCIEYPHDIGFVYLDGTKRGTRALDYDGMRDHSLLFGLSISNDIVSFIADETFDLDNGLVSFVGPHLSGLDCCNRKWLNNSNDCCNPLCESSGIRLVDGEYRPILKGTSLMTALYSRRRRRLGL